MTQPTVFIIQDEVIVAEELATKVRSLGYLANDVFATGEEALESAHLRPPNLVLLDLQLAGSLDGIETAKKFKQFDVPIIFITAHSDRETLKRVSAFDFSGYILKPISERDLAIQIDLALYKAQATKALREQEAALRESEEKFRYIFETAGVSIFEEDWSAIHDLLRDLRLQGVTDLRAYLDTHQQVVTDAISLVKIIDVNDYTLQLFKAPSKNVLLGALDRIFVPETAQVFKEELIAVWDIRSWKSWARLQTGWRHSLRSNNTALRS